MTCASRAAAAAAAVTQLQGKTDFRCLSLSLSHASAIKNFDKCLKTSHRSVSLYGLGSDTFDYVVFMSAAA